MPTLVLATHNSAKKMELQKVLSDSAVTVLTLNDFPALANLPAPEETGETYAQNALLKAQAAAQLTGMPSLADDSGIEVAALPKELGVRSARYVPGSDADRYTTLLQAMQNKTNRQARFVCALAYVDPMAHKHHIFEGSVEGNITQQPQGEHGFGYDPVFVPKGYTQTFAELDESVKNRISHRAKAVAQFASFLHQQEIQSMKGI